MRFSIIVPVYNVEADIERCLESIVCQTNNDWECICVDDGSTDSSGRILDEYADIEPRIRVIHSKNGGVVAARRIGLNASVGDWIWFVDGDDYIHKDALHDIERIIERNDPLIIKFNFDRVYADGTVQPNSSVLSGEKVERTSDLMQGIVASPLEVTGMCVWDKVYRRDVAFAAMRKVGEIEIRHSEDGLFAASALLQSNALMSVGKVLYHYVQRKDSALNRFNQQIVRDKVRFIVAMSSILKESEFYEKDLHGRMMSRLAHEGVVYVLTALCKWPVTVRQIFDIARELRESSLISLSWADRPVSCKYLRFVLSAYCPLLIVMQRMRMSMRKLKLRVR